MAEDKRVDDYIASAKPFAQPILTHLRKLIHRALPDVEECIKWGMPHFMIGGKNLVGLAAFKAHASMVIHHEEAKQGEGMGQFGKVHEMSHLPDDEAIILRLQRAAEAMGTPRPRKAKSKPDILVPDYFQIALNENPTAKATFDGFAPSHRREYLEWIVGAKRPETRSKRVTEAIAFLTEGKRRNWKYENC
ncbi:MAG: YdeI/OmpD-associated family protein [Pontixanthobacter sp.]